MVSKIIECTHLTQWKNHLAVIDWFNSLEQKKDLRFIELDIVSFYPSISKELFTLALDWAATMVEITEDDRELFLYTTMSILVHDGSTWVKKGDSNFDITMGAYQGAECCDLVPAVQTAAPPHQGGRLPRRHPWSVQPHPLPGGEG